MLWWPRTRGEAFGFGDDDGVSVNSERKKRK